MKKNVNIRVSDEELYKQICDFKKKNNISELCRKALEEELNEKTGNNLPENIDGEIDFSNIDPKIVEKFKKEIIKISPFKTGYEFGWKWVKKSKYEELIISKIISPLKVNNSFKTKEMIPELVELIENLKIPEKTIEKDLLVTFNYDLYDYLDKNKNDELEQWLQGFLRATNEFWDQIKEPEKDKK